MDSVLLYEEPVLKAFIARAKVTGASSPSDTSWVVHPNGSSAEFGWQPNTGKTGSHKDIPVTMMFLFVIIAWQCTARSHHCTYTVLLFKQHTFKRIQGVWVEGSGLAEATGLLPLPLQ